MDIQILRTPSPPPPTSAVRLSGELDLATARELQVAMHAEFRDGYGNLFVDMSEVTFMDSSGLHLLSWAQHRAHDLGGRIVLDPVSGAVRRFLAIAGAQSMLAA